MASNIDRGEVWLPMRTKSWSWPFSSLAEMGRGPGWMSTRQMSLPSAFGQLMWT
jgi:hypothetical protein